MSTKPRSWTKRLLFTLLALVVLGLAYESLFFLFPIQSRNMANRWALFRGGVEEITVGGLHGYEKDSCHGAAPGAGCTCVALIHGMGDEAMSWKKVLLAPEKDWGRPVRLYALDLPGNGHSPPPADPGDYRVRKMAGTLRGALAPLCPRFVVVGNSLGGWISAWVALDWKEGVEDLVLVDAAGLKSEVTPEQARSFFAEPTVESLKDFQRRAYFHPRELPDAVWREAVARIRKSNTGALMNAQVADDFLDTHLTELHLPTLVFWGEADRVTMPQAGKTLSDGIQGAVWREAPECGHMPQKECPAALVTAVRELLSR